VSDALLDRSRLKAVIFDVDGTLYEQGPLRRAMALRLARAHLLHPVRGYRVARTLAAYRRAQEALRGTAAVGDLRAAQVAQAATSAGIDPVAVERIVTQWIETVPLELLPRFIRPGVEGALRTLQAGGIRLAVLSDYPAAAKLQALGLAGHFDLVLCADDPAIGAFKPDPLGLQVAMARLGVDAREAIYVGDRADIDAVAARAAGLPCLLVTHSSEAGVAGPGVTYVSSFADITHQLEPA
jgi:phosphoglycolate phosphatase/putative hydrolase of the HAD superfamily